jgi:hypothetical protein
MKSHLEAHPLTLMTLQVKRTVLLIQFGSMAELTRGLISFSIADMVVGEKDGRVEELRDATHVSLVHLINGAGTLRKNGFARGLFGSD